MSPSGTIRPPRQGLPAVRLRTDLRMRPRTANLKVASEKNKRCKLGGSPTAGPRCGRYGETILGPEHLAPHARESIAPRARSGCQRRLAYTNPTGRSRNELLIFSHGARRGLCPGSLLRGAETEETEGRNKRRPATTGSVCSVSSDSSVSLSPASLRDGSDYGSGMMPLRSRVVPKGETAISMKPPPMSFMLMPWATMLRTCPRGSAGAS